MAIKIFSIIGSLHGGGAEKLVADLSYSFNKEYDHTIVELYPSKNKYSYSGDIILLNAKKRRWSFINSYFKLKKLKSENPNSIFISHLWVQNILNCLTYSKNHKQIITIHGRWSITLDRGKILDRITTRLYSKADKVVCVSDYMKKLYIEYHDQAQNVEVIYNGINEKEIIKISNDKPSQNLPEKYLIYVAGLRPVKNHLNLIDNLSPYLKSSDYHLVLVGEGEMREEIEEKIKSLDLQDKVTLTGNQSNPHSFVKNAKYALLGSLNESFCLTILEAMVLGVPVIVTDCGGPREVLMDKISYDPIAYPYFSNGGVIINKDLSKSIGAIIDSIDDKQYLDLSHQAQVRSSYFSLSKTAQNYIDIIKSL